LREHCVPLSLGQIHTGHQDDRPGEHLHAIFRSQAGAFRETSEHPWTDFVAVVKREHRVGPAIASKDLV
jgi:hypothetical protein